MRNGRAIAASVIGNICRNDAPRPSACPTRKFQTRNYFFVRSLCIVLFYLFFTHHAVMLSSLLFRDNANRLTASGSYKYEEKKVQQEKKYKLLNISFRKPVAKGILHFVIVQRARAIREMYRALIRPSRFLFPYDSSSRISGIVS